MAQPVYLHMHDPHDHHMHALKCIIRLVQRILHFGLHHSHSLVSDIVTYTVVDCGGCIVLTIGGLLSIIVCS